MCIEKLSLSFIQILKEEKKEYLKMSKVVLVADTSTGLGAIDS